VAGPIGLDFEHVNASLRAQGSAEVDVILGTDVFDAHAAIIDYPSQSLFLQAGTTDAVSHLSRVSLVVRDYEEAIAFFCEKLKFRLVEDRYIPAQDKRWVVVSPPGSSTTSIVLARASTDAQRSAIGNQTGGRVAFFLTTDDFWRDYNAMKAAGVEFTREPATEVYGTVTVFKDLYGNLWDLIGPATKPAKTSAAS
jgi:catechol 2,3-dioxygenase-like lactoylglutathione lyase family enzyme